jgi:hypothetical protein
MEVKHDFMDFL